jgi:aminoglycoside phosphotransferase (APT) family kinase protein
VGWTGGREMVMTPNQKMLPSVVQRINSGSRLLRAWPLKGGISAQMTALEIEQPDGRTKKLIVRQPGEASLRQNPAAAADEFKLLRIVRAAGLPAPTPHHLDESREILSNPYLVIEYVEGEPMIAPADLDDFARQLAAQLAKIHALHGSRADLSFLPRQAERLARTSAARPSILNDSLDVERIREVLEPVWPLPQTNEPVLLHGDFWPGNILCREGRIAAVIDWEEAEIGDPLSDVAISRLDLLWAFGMDAMHDFTARYKSMSTVDWANLPYWDLYAALRPVLNIAEWADGWSALGRTDITEETMRAGHRRFIAQSFEKLRAQ